MSIATAKASLDNGITRAWLCECASAIYQRILYPQPELEATEDPAMLGPVEEAIRLEVSSGEARIERTLPELVTLFRNSYLDRNGEEIVEDAVIPPRELGAWKGVARFLAYAVQSEGDHDAAEWIDRIVTREQQEIANAEHD
jgi:hypothetical protein